MHGIITTATDSDFVPIHKLLPTFMVYVFVSFIITRFRLHIFMAYSMLTNLFMLLLGLSPCNLNEDPIQITNPSLPFRSNSVMDTHDLEYTVTPSINQTLHQFVNVLPHWTLFGRFP